MAGDPLITGSFGAEGGAWSVLVHGGAGDLVGSALAAHVEGCRNAAAAAATMLAADGSALNAAQRAVEVLEDDPQFNAGTGACLNEDGVVQLDASIMEGTLLRAGGICALSAFKHPVAVARAVLNEGVNVLIAGEGAARFALSRGFPSVRPEDMVTEAARDRLARVRAGLIDANWAGGTVGAVVRDASGTVVAATSTGGRVNKIVGRVGDTPIIGAGTYADNEAGACSNTGDGEAFLRLCLAKTAIEWMRGGMHPEDAARAALRYALGRTQGTGGSILIDRFGRLGWARSTRSMSWAAASDGWSEVIGGG